MQTISVQTDTSFQALKHHADALLSAKNFKAKSQKGSASWTDDRIRPRDLAVIFKLAKTGQGVFFGVRKDHALNLGIPLASIGPAEAFFLPSKVQVCGAWITDSPAGRHAIESIVNLIP